MLSYGLDKSQWRRGTKIPGTVELLLLCVEETVDYKDLRSKVLECGQLKERGKSRGRSKTHWRRTTEQGLMGHEGAGHVETTITFKDQGTQAQS